MHRGEILNGLRLQIALMTGRSPLSAAILRAHARALRGEGQPALRELLLQHLLPRALGHPVEGALLALSAVHDDVLTMARNSRLGVQNDPLVAQNDPLVAQNDRLVGLFPTAGGAFCAADEARLSDALEGRAAATPPGWAAHLSVGELRPCEPLRALSWLVPARALQARQPLPLDVVQLFCGVGALLVGDLLSGDALNVARRVGLDPAPPDVADPRVQRELRASVWPDQPARLRLVDQALGQLLRLRGEPPTATPIFLVGPAADRLPEAVHHLRDSAAGPRRLLIFNALGTAGLDEDAYRRLQMRVRDALRLWAGYGPALWLELEPMRGALDPMLHLHAHRLAGPGLLPIHLGRLPPHPAGAAEFVRDAAGFAALLDDEPA